MDSDDCNEWELEARVQANLEKKRAAMEASHSAKAGSHGALPRPLGEADMGWLRTFTPRCTANEGAGERVFKAIGQGLVDLQERATRRGLPTRGPTWDALCAWEPSPESAAMDAALVRGSLFIVLSGSVGQGKSCLAAHAVLAARKAGGSPFFVDAALAAGAMLGRRDELSRRIDARLHAASLLTLDDIGASQYGTDEKILRAFVHLWERRIDYGLVTVVTTNLDVGDFGAVWFGERMVDRYRRHGASVTLQGASFRVASSRG